MKKRIVSALLVCVLGMSLVTGCGNNAKAAETTKTADGKIQLDLWYSGGKTAVNVFQDIVDAFNESQDKYEVKTTTQADYTETYEKLQAGIAGKKAPDMALLDTDKSRNLSEKNLPEDLVPYWDYDAPNIPNEPRDASAAACTASALYELDGYLPGNHYKETADKIMESLGSPAYRAKVGTNGNFILMHSVGSIPHGQEIDVPLNYADYYFLEGLMRKRDLEKK